MQYTLNLFKADQHDGILARAVQGDVLAVVHDHIADTGKEIRWTPVVADDDWEHRSMVSELQEEVTSDALESVRAFNVLRRGILRDQEALARALKRKNAKVQLSGVLDYFNPDSGRSAFFLKMLLSFPRVVVGSRIEIGGFFRMNSKACKTFCWPKEFKDTMPAALKELRDGKPYSLLDIADSGERFKTAYRANRLGFDDTVNAFKTYVINVGHLAGKDAVRKATRLLTALDRLVSAFGVLGIDGYARLDELADKVIDAISEMREELSASAYDDKIFPTEEHSDDKPYARDTYGVIGKSFTIKSEGRSVSYKIARKCTSKKGRPGIVFQFGKWQTPLELYSQRGADLMGALYSEYLLRLKGKSKTDGYVDRPESLKRNYSNAFPKSRRQMMRRFIETGRGLHKGCIRLVIPAAYL